MSNRRYEQLDGDAFGTSKKEVTLDGVQGLSVERCRDSTFGALRSVACIVKGLAALGSSYIEEDLHGLSSPQPLRKPFRT